ncbi:MAG: hypothetical protein NTY23_15660 [Chloroflexi bacterium]|nr:hypothetical protein [Chloroflexota bacterium]
MIIKARVDRLHRLTIVTCPKCGARFDPKTKAQHHVDQRDLRLLSDVELYVSLAILRKGYNETTPEDFELLRALAGAPEIATLVSRYQQSRIATGAADARPEGARSPS